MKLYITMYKDLCIALYNLLVCNKHYQGRALYSETCLERPLPLETTCFEGAHIPAEGPTFQCNWTCHQRPPVLRDHIFMAIRVVFQDRFHCSVRVTFPTRDIPVTKLLSVPRCMWTRLTRTLCRWPDTTQWVTSPSFWLPGRCSPPQSPSVQAMSLHWLCQVSTLSPVAVRPNVLPWSSHYLWCLLPSAAVAVFESLRGQHDCK